MATKPDSRRSRTTEPGISRVSTQPYVSKPDSEPPPSQTDAPTTEKEFDPFRFAVTELPTGMRQALIATKLPEVPAEQLFDTKPPNAHFASSEPEEDIPDSLPAVDASQALAVRKRAKRNVALGLLALTVIALALVFAARAPDQPKVTAAPTQKQSDRAPEQVAQPAIPPPSNEHVAEASEAPSSRLLKPAAPASERAPAAGPIKAVAVTQRAANSAQPVSTVTSGPPNAPPQPKKESALGSVLAPPPD